jgi:hypothetical protein
MSTDPVRIFIGSGEASALERKTLIYSLRKHTRRPLDLYVFNGTHNAVEHNDDPPQLAPMSLRVKYQNFTEFSLYRFLIPQLCQHQGRAIFIDSDTVCRADIGELFDAPMDGAAMMCTKAYGTDTWGPSVLLMDCSQCRFDLEQIVDEIEAGHYSYADFTQFGPPFLACHPHVIHQLDPHWNVFDRYDENTKVIHYTNLMTQPWKHAGHPCGELWFRYFREAVASGFISDVDIQKATWRGYARPDIREASEPVAPSTAKTKRPHWLKRLPRKLRKSA